MHSDGRERSRTLHLDACLERRTAAVQGAKDDVILLLLIYLSTTFERSQYFASGSRITIFGLGRVFPILPRFHGSGSGVPFVPKIYADSHGRKPRSRCADELHLGPFRSRRQEREPDDDAVNLPIGDDGRDLRDERIDGRVPDGIEGEGNAGYIIAESNTRAAAADIESEDAHHFTILLSLDFLRFALFL